MLCKLRKGRFSARRYGWSVSFAAAVTAISLVLGGCSAGGGAVAEPEDQKSASKPAQNQSSVNAPKPTRPKPDKRTMMIYIVGSDLESSAGCATEDIQEMLDADLDDGSVEVLLCAGGSSYWNNNIISADETSYYQVTDDSLKKVQTVSKKNMGDSDTLSDFLNWGASTYPADGYSLFLWNHGGGPMSGYGIDELAGDLLTLEELVTALEDSPFETGNKLEVLGFDACLMGSVETAWAFREYADFFVGSQEVEPGYGWYYEFLSQLPDCDNGGEIGKAIIDAYFDYYNALVRQNPQAETEITLSCVELSKLRRVEDALDRLFAKVNQDVLAGQLATVSRCRNRSKAFGKSGSSSSADLIDLKHLASLLSSSYGDATDLEQAVTEAVSYSRSNVKNANGLSIYHPYDDMSGKSKILNTYISFNFAEKYYDYMENFMSGMTGGGQSQSGYRDFSKTVGTATANGQGNDLSITLTPEQLETFSSAQYYVFWEMPAQTKFSGETEYLQVFSGQDVTLSEGGQLTASYNGKAVFGKNDSTGQYSDCPLSMTQIYDGSLEEKFYFPCIFWSFGESFDMEIENVRWLMKLREGVPVLLSAVRTTNTNGSFPDKQLLDPQAYELYTFANNSYLVSTDGNGNTEFQFSGSSYGFEYTAEDGFSMELRPIADKSQYRAVFLIEDVYGNRYFSDFIPLA